MQYFEVSDGKPEPIEKQALMTILVVALPLRDGDHLWRSHAMGA
jgi:hypothetical protein